MANEKLYLRWTDFESNISGALRELREDQGFYDVTLACDEDQIQAHKVILFWLQLSQINSQMFEMFLIAIPEFQAQVIIAACSPFFRTVLQRNPHSHPLLYLKGVHCARCTALCTFLLQLANTCNILTTGHCSHQVSSLAPSRWSSTSCTTAR